MINLRLQGFKYKGIGLYNTITMILVNYVLIFRSCEFICTYVPEMAIYRGKMQEVTRLFMSFNYVMCMLWDK